MNKYFDQYQKEYDNLFIPHYSSYHCEQKMVSRKIVLQANALKMYHLMVQYIHYAKSFTSIQEQPFVEKVNQRNHGLFSTLRPIYPSEYGEISSYIPLVDRLAQQKKYHVPSHIELDDLISAGYMGLIDGLQKYEPVKNVDKEKYLKIRINGAMSDYLSSMNKSFSICRDSVEPYRELVAQLESDGIEATDELLIEKLGVSPDDFYKIKQLANLKIVSADKTINNNKTRNSLIDFLPDTHFESAVDLAEKKECYAAVAFVVSTFEEKQQTFFSYYYLYGLSQKEIAPIISVGESRIFQIQKKVTTTLQKDVPYVLDNYQIIIP